MAVCNSLIKVRKQKWSHPIICLSLVLFQARWSKNQTTLKTAKNQNKLFWKDKTHCIPIPNKCCLCSHSDKQYGKIERTNDEEIHGRTVKKSVTTTTTTKQQMDKANAKRTLCEWTSEQSRRDKNKIKFMPMGNRKTVSLLSNKFEMIQHTWTYITHKFHFFAGAQCITGVLYLCARERESECLYVSPNGMSQWHDECVSCFGKEGGKCICAISILTLCLSVSVSVYLCLLHYNTYILYTWCIYPSYFCTVTRKSLSLYIVDWYNWNIRPTKLTTKCWMSVSVCLYVYINIPRFVFEN